MVVDIPTQIGRENRSSKLKFQELLGENVLLKADNTALRESKDRAYEERNRLVALLASLWPSGVAVTDIPGWDSEWHGCVYIDSPHGQLSWHFHDTQRHLFEHLPPYQKIWDGHTTEEKYERIGHAALAEKDE